jgi:hypothetical protein
MRTTWKPNEGDDTVRDYHSRGRRQTPQSGEDEVQTEKLPCPGLRSKAKAARINGPSGKHRAKPRRKRRDS